MARDAFTKRNHYNPCFWTALWNVGYFTALVEGAGGKKSPREQEVFALNVRTGRIYATSVERVHYDKGLGAAEVTPEAMKRFCKRWFPGEYERLARYVEANPETLYLDFEDILAAVEDKARYECLTEAACLGGISSPEHKGFLTCILVIHAMRSHEMMTAMLELADEVGLAKWEYFWLLKNAWGDPLVLARAATPLAGGQWILYRTIDHRFPLCDSPVMIGPHTLMAVLSPRLLVEINLNVFTLEDRWIIRDGISASKYREFRRRSIANSFKEIIFHDRRELERWSVLPELKARSRVLADPTSGREAVKEAASRVMWAVQGFGRVPPGFEESVRDKFHA